MRPHLSISQPHFSQVPPPQSFCLNVFGWRTCGIGELQAGQFTDSRLIPQPFFVTVPNATNRMPTKRSAIVTTNTTFITWSGMSTSIRISSNTPTTMLSRIAFAYFMPSRLNYAPSHQTLRTTLVGNRPLHSNFDCFRFDSDRHVRTMSEIDFATASVRFGQSPIVVLFCANATGAKEGKHQTPYKPQTRGR